MADVKTVKVGFLINPIAGLGGRVGLKGTDEVVTEALALGAEPMSPLRALQMLRELRLILGTDSKRLQIHWISGAGDMGAHVLKQAGFHDVEVLPSDQSDTGATRTRDAVTAMRRANVRLILFCGGDGTARDICSIVHDNVPILGIPAGVKMFSGVFGITPQRTALIVARFLKDEIDTAAADVMDLDEQRYRDGEFVATLFDRARVPAEPSYTQASKAVIESAGDSLVKQEIAQYLCDRMVERPDSLFVLGPGSTVQSLSQALGIQKTLLGVDALLNGKIVSRDLNEQGLLSLLPQHPIGALILSPIGAQGFVLGRGNQQLSPAVVRQFSFDTIWIVATPAKLAKTPGLRFDTGDVELDEAFGALKFWSVITGYRHERAVPILS